MWCGERSEKVLCYGRRSDVFDSHRCIRCEDADWVEEGVFAHFYVRTGAIGALDKGCVLSCGPIQCTVLDLQLTALYNNVQLCLKCQLKSIAFIALTLFL